MIAHFTTRRSGRFRASGLPAAIIIAPTNTPHTIPVRFGCALRVPDFPLEAEREFDREFNFVWDFRAKARFLRMQSEGWRR